MGHAGVERGEAWKAETEGGSQVNFRTTVLFILLAAGLSAQSSELLQTGTLYNGRAWNRMSETMKTFYVAGMTQGMATTGLSIETVATCLPGSNLKVLNFVLGEGRTTTGDSLKWLDQFYQDPANVEIPIGSALIVYARKLEGVTESGVQTIIAAFRADALAARTRGNK